MEKHNSRLDFVRRETESGEFEMYRGLWNFITRFMDKGHAVSVFLPAMIIAWTLAGVAAGTAACALAGMNLSEMLADIVCAGGYAGILLGLLGGMLFLHRTDI